MPIYEYECMTCGENFEKRQSFSAEAKADCPTCNATETRRLISTPAIVFKGSGFYINDSKKSKNGTLGTGSQTTKSETKSSDSKTSEKKTSEESKAKTKSSDS